MTNMRQPRGYGRNVPNYQELCEGVRPTDTAAPRVAYTGLPHVRVDETHHDPIVLDPGTIVGRVSYTGAATTLFGTIVPCILPTGTVFTFAAGITGVQVSVNSGLSVTPLVSEPSVVLRINGSAEGATYWGLQDGTSGNISNIGYVKPMGVISQPIYSFFLQAAYTNYTRNVNVPLVTDYVIMVPATNPEEHAIRDGDVVVVGSGEHYGIGWTNTNVVKAGRYARYNPNWAFADERAVGRCLKKIRIATTSTTSAGTVLSTDTGNVTLTAEAQAEFKGLAKVQTVPGLGLSGSGTAGIPSNLLDATLDSGANYPGSTKCYWALVILIRL